MGEFLNIDEISRHLAIKKSSIYSMVEKGEIPHYRFGRLVRFKKTQIDAWMLFQKSKVLKKQGLL